MADNLEQLVLSGKLFEDHSSPSSPVRSHSPNATANADWPDLDPSSGEHDPNAERSKQIDKLLGTSHRESIGMGTGRTGVKGVIRDRDESEHTKRAERARELAEINKRLERTALTARTFREEEDERLWEKQMLEVRGGAGPPLDFFGEPRRGGRFGHLREVGLQGFLPAIEQEERSVWVVVHIYAPSLDRCYALDDSLSLLARQHLGTKFLRCRAGALGFASSSGGSTTSNRTRPARRIPGGLAVIDDEDGDDSPAEDEYDEYDDDDDDESVDLDMLPTMLVYRGGDLVFNWVRVDLEAGRGGIDDLLAQHHVIHPLTTANGNCGLPSDEEDELSDG